MATYIAWCDYSLPTTQSLLINFCTWQMLVAITGFSNFSHCIVERGKPTTTIYWFWKIGRQYTIANIAYDHCRWRQLSVFINMKRMNAAFCFTDLTSETHKNRIFPADVFVVWRKFWFHFIVNALKMESKIDVFPYANTFDLKKSFNPKWNKCRTGLQLSRVLELMLSEKLNRHKKYD